MCYTNEANTDNECRLLFQLLLEFNEIPEIDIETTYQL